MTAYPLERRFTETSTWNASTWRPARARTCAWRCWPRWTSRDTLQAASDDASMDPEPQLSESRRPRYSRSHPPTFARSSSRCRPTQRRCQRPTTPPPPNGRTSRSQSETAPSFLLTRTGMRWIPNPCWSTYAAWAPPPPPFPRLSRWNFKFFPSPAPKIT